MSVVAVCASCRFFEHRGAQDVVAGIGQEVLTADRLQSVTRLAVDSADSARIAEDYIRQWAEDVLFYKKAVSSKDPQIESKVEQYRRDLYIHALEEKLVRQKMDKSVSQADIEAFYSANEDMFRLEDALLRGLLLVVPNGTPDMPKLRKWMMQYDAEIENIEKYAYNYATGYELFTDDWKTAVQVRRYMPLRQQEFINALRQKKQIEVQDSLLTYVLQVSDKRLPGEQMPVEYAEPGIRKILLGERQADFIRQQKAEMYKDAERLFRIKRYDKNENEQ